MNSVLEDLFVGLAVAAIASAVAWLYRKRLRGIRQIYGESIAGFYSARDALEDIRRECFRSSRMWSRMCRKP
jgi:hypothetical protein